MLVGEKPAFSRPLLVVCMAVPIISHTWLAVPARSDFVLGEAVHLSPTINPAGCPNLSADGLELYFASYRSGGYGDADLWVSTRAGKEDPWGEPTNLGAKINSSGTEWFSTISQDGLSLYFCSTRPDGFGGADLWLTTRRAKGDDWGTPVNLGSTINSAADEHQPSLSPDGCTLLWCSSRLGGRGGIDIWMAKRTTKNDPWGAAEDLGAPVNSEADDARPNLSSDGLALFFRSSRPGTFGGPDLWLTTRATIGDAWKEPIHLGPPVNTPFWECGPSISHEGSLLYFHSDRPGGFGPFDIWQVSISPVVDFNGDEIVDVQDLLQLIEAWGTDDPLCDIGPFAWGDGIVDRADLDVLMSYWGQEIPSPFLIGHWKLDEAEGIIAFDSAGTSDGVAVGDPVWQPAGGKLGGALELDGVDDCVTVEYVCDPSESPFSVFVWVKGGTPSQTILSQVGGVNWLMADASGFLMTELTSGGRSARLLYSDAIITDGVWHRVGFAWDGSNRSLYADGVLVAEDTQSGLAACAGGLQIGCGKDMAPGSFWSGLMDDVRIYYRVVEP